MDNRIRRVMIACVTFETYKVSEPVDYYGANVVYLIHYVVNPMEGGVYQEFFDRTRELILGGNASVEFHGLNRHVSDYSDMLKTINSIIMKERDLGSEMMINLSSGSAEYIAAAATASMMEPSIKAFFVRVGEYTVSSEKIREIYYEDGHPVGLAKSVRDVTPMPEFRMEMPDELLVRALRIYARMVEEQRVFAPAFIGELKRNGLWNRRGEIRLDQPLNEKEANNEKVFFQRRYIDEWKKRGWIEKSGTSYRTTEQGRVIISVLYPDEDVNLL